MNPSAHGDPALAPVQWRGRFLVAHVTPAGWEFVTRASGPNAVVICACDPQGRVLFVEQYRVPLGRRVLEFPAGLVGDDASTGDDILATAQRELIEECGYEAGRLQLFGSGPVSAGLTDETLYFVGASELRRVGAGGGVEGEEDITVHAVLPEAVPSFLRQRRDNGTLIDIKCNLGLAVLGLPPVWIDCPGGQGDQQ